MNGLAYRLPRCEIHDARNELADTTKEDENTDKNVGRHYSLSIDPEQRYQEDAYRIGVRLADSGNFEV